MARRSSASRPNATPLTAIQATARTSIAAVPVNRRGGVMLKMLLVLAGRAQPTWALGLATLLIVGGAGLAALGLRRGGGAGRDAESEA